MAYDVNELKQKRATIVHELRELHEGVIERGHQTAEEKEKYEAMEKDCRSLEQIIEREETIQEEERKLAAAKAHPCEWVGGQ